MVLNNVNIEIVEKEYLFGYDVIDEKTKYSFKILEKFEQIRKLENYSNTTDLFFMITHLQTKYMYDIELRLKRKKHKALVNLKRSYVKLNNILNELKKNHNNYENVSFDSVIELYTTWLNEQKEIDIELTNLFK